MREKPDTGRTVAEAVQAAPAWQRRVVTTIVACLTRFLGLGLLFAGGRGVLTAIPVGQAFGAPDWPMLVLGLVLIAASAVTMVVSRSGIIIAAGIELVIALAVAVVPYAPDSRGTHPTSLVRHVFAAVFPGSSTQAGYAAASGFLLVFAAVSLAAALGIRSRIRAAHEVAQMGRIVGMAGAVVLSIPAALLIWMGGSEMVTKYHAFSSETTAIGAAVLLLIGTLLCAAIAWSSRFSAAGLYAFGLFWITIWIAFGLFLSTTPTSTRDLLPTWITETAVVWCLSGFAGVLAVFLLTSGIVERILSGSARRRRGPRSRGDRPSSTVA